MKKIIYLSLALICLLSLEVVSQVPKTLNYQGFLTEAEIPVNKPRDLVVSILFVDSLVHTESFLGYQIDKGFFNVTLGATAGNPLPTDFKLWKKPLTIVVKVNNTVIGNPVPFTTVPYSFLASNVDNIHVQDLADGMLTGSKIGTGIDAGNISSGTLSIARIADGDVTSAKITDGSITNSDISASAAIAGTKIDGATITGISATNITAGTLPITRIADGDITSAKITDGTITNADISGSAAIAGTKIDGTTITSISAANITTGTLPITRIADGDITSAKITDGTITNADISGSAAIAGSKIGTGISASNVTSGTLSGSLVGTGISATNVTAGTLSGALVGTGISATNVTTGSLSGGLVGTGISATNVTTGTLSGSLVGTGISATNITAGTLPIARIADGDVTSLKIADGTIVSGDISDGTIASVDILDGTIASADILDATVTSSDIAANTIVDADISGSAAIAGSKVTPAFVAQNISTTGYATVSNGLHVGSATAPSAGNLEVDGFTKFGLTPPTNATVPSVKVAKYTFNTHASTTTGGSVGINHNLDYSKIISISVHVLSLTNLLVHPGFTVSGGLEYNYYISSTEIRIVTVGGNCANVADRQARIVITYEP